MASDRLMKDEITQITLDCMMGIREGVGKCRTTEFKSYIDTLLKAKEGKIAPETIQWPMLMDRVKQLVDATLAARASSDVTGGIEWKFISLAGGAEQNKQQGIRVQVEMEFMSIGAPDFELIRALSVNELQQLSEILEASTPVSVGS